MYDLTKKIIFTHPHKCGGTSIEDLLGFLKLRDKFPSIRPFKHATLSTHIEKLQEKNINLDGFFKFAIIRNPWARVVSFYEHHKHRAYDFYVTQQATNPTPPPVPKVVADARTLTFKQFVFKYCRHDFNSDSVTKPFMFFNNEFFLDYVIRLEKIEEDINTIGDKLQINLSCGIPHRNDSIEFAPRIHYTDYYDHKAKTYIKEKFEWDIKTFNYSFDN
jgi:hypothetical protein